MTQKARPLLFIDTNILLDFYRNRNDAGINLLKHVDALHDTIITSYQVEMEFKKNRQNAIKETVIALKGPEASISPPAFLSDAKPVRAMRKQINDTRARIRKLKGLIAKVLQRPTTADPVYKIVQRLFLNESELNLTRNRKERFAIRRKAWKRFVLGYPPRKQGDTSIGDAINWEWIIHCVSRTKRDVIIASRDSDYGTILDDQAFINDWLAQEFRKRVSKKRKISLYDRLSLALKALDVTVTKEEEKADEEIAIASPGPTAANVFEDYLRALELPPLTSLRYPETKESTEKPSPGDS